jgi:hypothetical protein
MAEAAAKTSDRSGGSGNPLTSIAHFAGEAVLPGSSQVLKGDVTSGVTYGLAGLAAMVMFGPVGRLVVGGASYAKAHGGPDVVAALKGQAHS